MKADSYPPSASVPSSAQKKDTLERTKLTRENFDTGTLGEFGHLVRHAVPSDTSIHEDDWILSRFETLGYGFDDFSSLFRNRQSIVERGRRGRWLDGIRLVRPKQGVSHELRLQTLSRHLHSPHIRRDLHIPRLTLLQHIPQDLIERLGPFFLWHGSEQCLGTDSWSVHRCVVFIWLGGHGMME